jgi:prephenate dehydratase
MTKNIAIQGFEGSFHQKKRLDSFMENRLQLFVAQVSENLSNKQVHKKNASGAVMAIENSIAGSILPNYTLLQKSNLVIIGEVYLQIKQQLLVNKRSAIGRYS